MPTPLYTPRINNNDDVVKVSHIFIEIGAPVRTGEPIVDIETDKATFTVEAEKDGYLLAFNAQKGDMVAVGSILAWLGASPSEEVPASESAQAAGVSSGTRRASLKASLLLTQYGIDPASVPQNGDRLTAADVEKHIRDRGLSPVTVKAKEVSAADELPFEAGRPSDFTSEERGMLRTVAWHGSVAVPGYVEIPYSDAAWEAYAAAFRKAHNLLLNPLLALQAWRLARIAVENPRINATIAGSRKYTYTHVNLGFTVQSGSDLYVVVVREAETLTDSAFVERLTDLQRSALKKKLGPRDTEGATLTFSSMARWNVARHIPVLMPHTSIIVAHAAGQNGIAHLGATYDHRLLTGADAASVLLSLSKPGED
jgi:pyruvate/2-oxoglutarate dehydrogenase complex dihydrolipoamide acyltransferase (E2) component